MTTIIVLAFILGWAYVAFKKVKKDGCCGNCKGCNGCCNAHK